MRGTMEHRGEHRSTTEKNGRRGLGVDEQGVPLGEALEVPKPRLGESMDFGAFKVARHRFLPGEIEVPPFGMHLVNVHISAPHRLVQRRSGRTHEGLKATGGLDIIPANTPSYWRTDAASEEASLLLEDWFVRRVAEEADADPDGFELVPLFSVPDPSIRSVGLSLLAEMETGGLGGELLAESLAKVLALHLLRQHSSLGRRSARKLEREGGAFSKRAIGRATDYVNDNLSRKITLTELAGTARMSPFHFARSFKAATGLSPHQYVIQKRVERASRLLAGTDLSVSEVAAAVGFANRGHLAAHVRRLLGVSPKDLRGGG